MRIKLNTFKTARNPGKISLKRWEGSRHIMFKEGNDWTYSRNNLLHIRNSVYFRLNIFHRIFLLTIETKDTRRFEDFNSFEEVL